MIALILVFISSTFLCSSEKNDYVGNLIKDKGGVPKKLLFPISCFTVTSRDVGTNLRNVLTFTFNLFTQ